MGTFVIVLLIVLLLFSDRLAGAGKGLGEAVKNFKRSLNADDPSAGSQTPPVIGPAVTPAPPKLLPARGETTSNDDESGNRKV